MKGTQDPVEAGQASYEEWRDDLRADPEYQAIYDEEAARSALWLQLVEARQAAGLTRVDVAERLGVSPAQVARIEKRGYDVCSLNTLRRYLAALQADYTLEVTVRQKAGFDPAPRAAVGR
jgi:DNA-binding XRE family transcriptional regulator